MSIPPADLSRPIPWWLWPNVLALDAPAVGVLWQRFFGTVFDVPVPIAVSATLALVIWALYLTDRWIDANFHSIPEPTDRHRFARRFRIPLAVVAFVVWIASAVVAGALVPAPYLKAGAGIAGMVAGYFAVVHLARLSRILPRGGKEGAVGILFAAGVGIPLVATAGDRIAEWMAAVAAFASICWLNCEWISHWENLMTRPATNRGWIAAALGMILALNGPLPVTISILASIAALVSIHLFHGKLSGRAARVLADVALLTPLFWFVL